MSRSSLSVRHQGGSYSLIENGQSSGQGEASTGGAANLNDRSSFRHNPVEEMHVDTSRAFIREGNPSAPLFPDMPFSRQQWDDNWGKEVLCWLISLIFFVALTGVLSKYDGKERPELSSGMTLNTLASLLLTIAYEFIKIPVSAAIGQIKWIRARDKPRPLAEYCQVDEAAKGTYGSLMLLLGLGTRKLPGGMGANVGALLTILLLTTGPAFQAVVSSEPGQRPSTDTPRLPVARMIKSLVRSQDGRSSEPSAGIKRSLYSGLLGDARSQYNITSSCDTNDNCTWEDYYTMAFCSSCSDITNQVPETAGSHMYTLPGAYNQLFLNVRPDSGVEQYIFNSTFENLQSDSESSFVMQFTAIAVNRGNELGDISPLAMQCRLEPCVKRLRGKATGDTSVETLVGLWKASNLSLPFQPHGSNSLAYSVDGASWDGLWEWAKVKLRGSFAIRGEDDDFTTGPFGNVDLLAVLYRAATMQQGSIGMAAVWENIALSMTAAMRMEIFPSIFDSQQFTFDVPGVATHDAAIVKVKWGWIALPFLIQILVLCFMTYAFLLGRGSSMGSWKDSSMATVCHGLGPSVSDKASTRLRSGDMKDEARTLVRLYQDSDHWRLERS